VARAAGVDDVLATARMHENLVDALRGY